MGWWTERVLPRIVDRVCATGDLQRLRTELCAGLEGAVLEVGFGSGLNVPAYPAAVTAVTAVEPADLAWRLAQGRIDASRVPVRRGGLDGQRLELPDDSHDSAVSTFTLCTIPDLPAALAEIHRVLKPGGRFHFLEHGRAHDAGVARWQQRLTPVHRRLAGGCHLDRPIPEMVGAAGFEIEECAQFYGEGPKVTSYLSVGTARVSGTVS
jgi:ubiquinone/menaquinone biosynthesis C-methylase UbiE